MHRPPRRVPRAANPVSVQSRVAAGETQAGVAPAADGLDRQRLVDEFEAALREERDLGAEERDAIVRQYRNALQIAPVELAPPDLDALRASFLQMTEAMSQEQVIKSSEREGLVQQFYSAIEPLDSAELRRSTEFARRLQEDGVEAANAWRSAQVDDATSAEPAVAAAFLPPINPALRARRQR